MYHPWCFFTLIMCINGLLYWLCARGGGQLFLLLTLLAPALLAVVFIYSGGLASDFWARWSTAGVSLKFWALILLLLPCTVLVATALSCLLGYSTDQFQLSASWSVAKGWVFLGVAIPLCIAPLLEEVAWRGYWVDSLVSRYGYGGGTLLFGCLWALWHVPAFCVPGYYQNRLLDLGYVHVANFFISVVVVACLMNWVYFNVERSIPALIIFHSVINLSCILWQTEPATRCITTILLAVVVLGVAAWQSPLRLAVTAR